MKEYRIVGTFGGWGEIYYDLTSALIDLDYARKAHPSSSFKLQERDVSHWRDADG